MMFESKHMHCIKCDREEAEFVFVNGIAPSYCFDCEIEEIDF